MVLLAQIVDDEFQSSVQEIFDIDRGTNAGHIAVGNGNEEKGDDEEANKITYIRGPVKMVERARSKAANDYADREYPSTACVVDLNRCCLIFDDIKTLLAAIKLFENKVKYYQSGNIIDIVRDKNGFIDYTKKVQYADIKLNVLIRGESHNIIGEIQFLLRRMKEFKDKAHNLYGIQRDEEFVSGAVKHVLPNLLNVDKQRNISVLNNDVKGLCNVMVFGNKSNDDIIGIDKIKNESILQRVCISGNVKLFRFIQSLLTEQELVDRLFLSNWVYNQTPLEEAIQLKRHDLAEYILSLPCIQKKIQQKDDKILWRLILFICIAGDEKTLYYFNLLNSLRISNEDIAKYFKYKYPKITQKFLTCHGWWKYDACTMTNYLLRFTGKVDQLKRILSVVGEDILAENIMTSDGWNKNGLEAVLSNSDIDTLKYLLSLNYIRERCMKDKDTRWRIIFWICKKGNDEIFKWIISELKFTMDELNKLCSYSYPKPNESVIANLQKDCMAYWNEKISPDVVEKFLN